MVSKGVHLFFLGTSPFPLVYIKLRWSLKMSSYWWLIGYVDCLSNFTTLLPTFLVYSFVFKPDFVKTITLYNVREWLAVFYTRGRVEWLLYTLFYRLFLIFPFISSISLFLYVCPRHKTTRPFTLQLTLDFILPFFTVQWNKISSKVRLSGRPRYPDSD